MNNVTCEARPNLPNISELINGLTPDQVILLVIGTSLLFAIYSLSITHIYFIWKNVQSEHKRNKLYTIGCLYPFVGSICVLGMVSPRSGSIFTSVGILGILYATYNVVSLPRVIYKTREELSQALMAENSKIKLQTPPLCCCVPCFPKPLPTTKNIVCLEKLVLQATFVRFAIVLISIIIMSELEESKSERLLRIADLSGVPSLLMAIYASHVLIRLSTKYLKKHRMMVLFRLTVFTLILFSGQFPLVFELIFLKLGMFSCGPVLSATGNAKFVFFFVVLCEMFLMSLIGTIMLAPKKSLLIDAYKPTTEDRKLNAERNEEYLTV